MFGFAKKLFSGSSPDPKFTPQFTSEMQRELEAIGSGTGGSDLTAGIGMIKMGTSELLPGWIELFGRSAVYSVSVDDADIGVPFVFGPPDDRNYVAVFTTELLAKQCVVEMPPLKSVIPFIGHDLVRAAEIRGLGLWINPLNEACTLKVPAAMVARFIA